MTTPGPPDHPLRLLFACAACARDDCRECVHLTVGAWCPHLCWWALRPRDQWPNHKERP